MNGRSGLATTDGQGPAITPEQQREQLDKLLCSDVFKTARGLQKFLEYVGSKSLAGLSEDIKEYSIGTEVFGRPSDYDPRIDTMVRVQALRLREKLREYYDGEGAADEVLVDIPKGHYIPRFTRRTLRVTSDAGTHPSSAPAGHTQLPGKEVYAIPALPRLEPVSAPKSLNPAPMWLRFGLVATLFLGIGFVIARGRGHAWQPGNGSDQQSKTEAAHASPPADLWTGFMNNESSPMVAYCNDVFLKTESSDLLRVKNQEVGNLGATPNRQLASSLSTNPQLLIRAGPVTFDDTYTGTGEVMGVYYLTRMFGHFQAGLGVKRSRLVTTDDLSRHDMIFLGSTRENSILAGLPLIQDFVFDWPQSAGVWKGRIINLRPRQGEPSYFVLGRDPKTNVLRTDYGVVSFLPGIAPNRKIVVLAGMTTLGTQGAAQFATSQSGMTELWEKLGRSSATGDKRMPSFFQAVLKVEVMRGEILSVTYVTGHVIRPSQNLPQEN